MITVSLPLYVLFSSSLNYSSWFHLLLLYQGLIFFSFSFLPSAYSYSCIFSFLLLLLLIFHSSSLSSSYLFVKICFFLLFPVVSLFEFKSHPSLFLFLLRPIGRRSVMGVLAPPRPATERSWWPVDLVNNNYEFTTSFFIFLFKYTWHWYCHSQKL